MRRLLTPLAVVVAAIALAPLAAIAPASAATSPSLAAVEVTGNAGEKPAVTSEWPFKVKKSVSEVRTEGTGTAAAKGDVVSVDYLVVNGRTGDELQASYDTGASAVRLDSSTIAAVRKALIGTAAGSRVVVAVAPKDGVAANGQSVGIKKNDTLLYVIDVNDVTTPLTRATGTPVDPVDGLPTVELNENGSPKIFMPKADAPTELVVQPLIVGDGPVVEAGQTVEVQYTGAIWDTGKVFDSSWKRSGSFSFPVGAGQVIDGWDQGLVGQTVGSQVLLVVPPDMGYGESGNPSGGIKGTDTLVFVVDILSAT